MRLAPVAICCLLVASPFVLSPGAIAQAPDLAVDIQLDRSPVIEGYSYRATLSVLNKGGLPAANFTLTYTYSYSHQLGADQIRVPMSEPLLPGERRIVREVTFTATQGLQGFSLDADVYDEVPESDEGNNFLSIAWDGLHRAERPIARITIAGNVSEVVPLPAESARIYNVTLRRGDSIRYEVRGLSDATIDVFLFLGERNLLTLFGFGELSAERAHSRVTYADGLFSPSRSDFVYLVVDNLSEGPDPPIPQPLNVSVSVWITRAPVAAAGQSPFLLWIPLILGAALAIPVFAFWISRRRR